MFHSKVIGRFGSAAAACGAVALLYAGVAQSQTCSASFQSAKEKEDAGRLIEARDQYASCARKECGAFLLNECTTRHARLDSDIPSVVAVAADTSGESRNDVKVTLDGESFLPRIDGRSLRVNPGMHEFVFTGSDGVSATEKVMVLQGDRNRRIAVTLSGKHAEKAKPVEAPVDEPEAKPIRKSRPEPEPEPETAPTTQESRSKGIPAGSWVLGGLSAVGVGGFVLFSHWGRKTNDTLSKSCGATGSCQQASVDHVKRDYLLADISLGAGVAALAGAVLAYAVSGPSKREHTPEQQAYRVNVQPTPSGAVASLSGSF
jgi:hypothetical protein